MSENSNSKRFAMTKFRERGVLVERLAEAFKTKTPEQMTEVNNATAEFVVHNTELRSAFDADAVCATQFFTLCKRTHWVVDAEGANLNLLAKSTDPVVQYGDSLNAGFHDACRPPCGAPLAQLTPLTSLFDIGCMANANARLDRYLLCRVTALVPFAQDELYLVAEDAERTEFWVRFPPYDSRVCKAMFSDGPDCVVALKAPQVALHGANWDPLLLAFSADCELLHDRSSELLRGTPWFVAPADTPLDWKLRGNASFAKQRHCEAAACYSRGLELDADNVDLRANRANAYLKVGEWHKALDDADAVLARDAKHLKCAMRRASALFKLARIADADAAWKRARALAVTAADIGECEQAARKLAAADARSRGKVDSSGSGDDDLSTYVHPNIARVPSAKHRRFGMRTSAPIAKNTVLVIEPAIAVAAAHVACNALLAAGVRDATRRELLRALGATFSTALHDETMHPSYNDLEIAMMIVTKAVPFDAAGEQLVGVALHCTLINQSCEPNCVVQRVGDGTMVIKATTDIAANSELSVPAYSLSDSVSSMMREEVRALHTLCACQRCSQEATKQPAKV